MEDLTRRVAELERALNSGQRRAFNIRVNGEEHSATSRVGVANILFPIDGQGMTFSECMFKLVFNDGAGAAPVIPGTACGNFEKGRMLYPTLESWKKRYPIGSGVDVDCSYGMTCWDYAAAFWWGQVNRRLETGVTYADNTSSPGNGYAWGTLQDAVRATNLGSEFELITRWSQIQPGDWVVWGNYGTGHIAMAVTCAHNDWEKVGFWQQSGDGNDGGKQVFASQDGSQIWGGNTFQGAFRLKGWNTGGCSQLA